MHQYSHSFFLIGQAMSKFSELEGTQEKIDATTTQTLLVSFPDKLIAALQEVGLTVSTKQAEFLLNTLKEETATWADLKREGEALARVIEHEASSSAFVHLPTNRAAFYQDDPLFGEAVANKFPKAVTDIQESGKCFALSRYTATVFHLMRVMELATQYLGKRLGITLVSEKNWANILDQVDKAIKALPNKNSSQKARRNRFSEASIHLRMVKDAWRNDVMHPQETYTEEEAERVFRNVKDFMTHLSTKLWFSTGRSRFRVRQHAPLTHALPLNG